MASEMKPELIAPVMASSERDAAVVVLRWALESAKIEVRDSELVRGAVEALQTAPLFVRRELEANGLVAAAQNRLGAFERSSPTSRSAALRNYPRSGTQRMEVLHRVKLQGDAGATRDELVVWLGKAHNVVTPRVKELVVGGWLQVKLDDSGAVVTRVTRARSQAEVLVLSDRAKAELVRREQRS